jgi:hypothetical protein
MGAVVKGALAGAAGTLAMDLIWYRRYKQSGGGDDFVDWEFSAGTKGYDEAGAPAQVGKRVVEGLFQTELDPSTAAWMNNGVHWGTGIGWGTLYGLAAGSGRTPKVAFGPAFGAIAWLTSYVVLPLAKLYEPLWRYDARTLGRDLGAHLVFGSASAAAFRALTTGSGRGRD